MKKRIFGILLMGAMVVASMSMFTSCKDYDDDIQANKDDITALKTQLATLQTAAATAQSAADAARSAADAAATAAKNAQTSADAAGTAAKNAQASADDAAKVASANATAIKAAQDAIKALEDQVAAFAKVEELNAVKADLEKAIADATAGKVSAEELTETLKPISAKIDAIDESLNTLTADVKALKEWKATVEGQIAAVQQDLKNQAEAIKALQEEIKNKLSKGDLSGLANEEAIKAYLDNQLKAYATSSEISTAIANALKTYTTTADLKKMLEGYSTPAAVQAAITNALQDYYTVAKTDEKVKALTEAVEAAQATAGAATTAAQVESIAQKIAEKVGEEAGEKINTLNVLVTKRLTSIVFDPQFFWGGIESMEAPRLYYWPLKYNVSYNAKKPYNAADQTGTLIQIGQVNQNDPNEWFIPIEANYFMNPSTADIESITGVTAYSADKNTYTRAAACNPTVVGYTAKNGILTAKIAVDWYRIANRQELNLMSGFETATWDNTQQTYVYNWTNLSQGNTVYTQEGEVSILALQASVKGEDADTVVTSDFAAIAPSQITDFRIVDNDPTRSRSCNIEPWGQKRFHVYTRELQAIQNTYSHNLIWNDENGIDLDEVIEVHATRVLNVKSGAYGEIKLKDLKEKYGLELKYELIEYTSGDNKTEETYKHATLNGSILKATGINGEQTKASIGREPLVKIELIDTNNKNALVQVGFIKFQIVGEKAPDVTVKTYESTTYYLCGGDTYFLKWSDVEGDILANNEIVKDGVSKTTFEQVYAIAQGSNGTSWSSINWSSNQVGTTYLQVDGSWTPYSMIPGYDDDIMNYLIGYHGNYAYDNNQQQTNVFGVTLTKQQEQYLLAKRSGDPLNPYLKSNGQKTTDWTQAALNTEATITIAVRLVDKNKSGYPDIYVPFKLTVNTLHVTLNKIPEYWYASNSTTAKSGFDEIHVNVDVVGEPSSVVSHFAGDLFSTIYKNDHQLAAKPAWDATVGKAHGIIAAEGYAIDQATRSQIDNDGGLKVYLAFRQGTQASGNNSVTAKGKIVNGASGRKYFVYPRTSSILAAYNWDGNKITGTPINIVTIDNSAIDGLTATKSVFKLDNATQNKVLEDILNYAPHTNLANSLTATVGVTVIEGDCGDVPVILTNPIFDVKFLRPLNPEGAKNKEFTDATDGGNKLNILDLISLTDWRDQWSAVAYDDNGLMTDDTYWKYYEVNYIKPDLDNITTTMGGGTLGTTKLKDVSNQVKVTYNSTGANHKLKDGKDFGTLTYTNNNNTVTEFTIRVPLTVGYYWAKEDGYGFIRTYVDIKVKNTKNN